LNNISHYEFHSLVRVIKALLLSLLSCMKINVTYKLLEDDDLDDERVIRWIEEYEGKFQCRLHLDSTHLNLWQFISKSVTLDLW
jgi:hypothetical protein